MNRIKERLSNTNQLAKMILEKNKIMWCENDRWIFVIFRHLIQKGKYITVLSRNIPLNDLVMIYGYLEKSFYVIFLFISAFGLLMSHKTTDNIDYCNLLIYCAIMFIAYWGIHNFIEIQTRYRFCIMHILFLISSSFWNYLFSCPESNDIKLFPNKI